VKVFARQVNALGRAFFVRFFESEITTGTDDLKQFFFWLLGALAVPGLFIPWIMSFEWQLLALVDGGDALRIASRAEKTFYLGFSMIASGVLTAIAWSSLLPDRRDTLILGAMPIQPRTVVVAKLVALAAYVGLVAVAMHAAGSIFWGSILGDKVSLLFTLRGIAAHFVACAAASISVLLAVAAAQGLTLTLAGPRLFRRLSTVLQVVVVGLVVFCLASLPTLNTAIVHTLGGGPRAQPWILSMPPVWFLGLYEWLLGTSDPLLVELARRAGITIGCTVVATILTFPLAYRRLMVSVVETGDEPSNAVARAVHSTLVRAAGRHPAPRAAAEFFTATIARVDRHRFVLAISVGLAIAWGLPGLRAYVPSARPTPELLALPMAIMMFLTAGLRIAASLPSDVRAAWLFEVHDLSRRDARRALERTILLLGVVPSVALSTPVYWYLWGSAIAISHAMVMSALGVALVELLIWHSDGMPCGQRWTPARMDFGRRWPVHLALFLIVVWVIPRLELILFRKPYAFTFFIAFLLVLAASVRYASARHQIVPVYEDVDPVAGVLRLN
jgi:hypothetical protein